MIEEQQLRENFVLYLSEKDAKKFVEMSENPPKPSDNLCKLLKPIDVMAGTTEVHTRAELSAICKQIGIDFD